MLLKNLLGKGVDADVCPRCHDTFKQEDDQSRTLGLFLCRCCVTVIFLPQ